MPFFTRSSQSEKIRADELIKHIPILFVSSSNYDGLNENPKNFNCDDFVAKQDDNFYIKDKIQHYTSVGQLNNVMAKMNNDKT